MFLREGYIGWQTITAQTGKSLFKHVIFLLTSCDMAALSHTQSKPTNIDIKLECFIYKLVDQPSDKCCDQLMFRGGHIY